eukprot:TRINITY_DN10947_c0_g1_i1.p1 TRINITY_DN10947_c0_g1~~TRINITY_DN10947_c0_g1_i1.p1  ORF type:complete len:513 (-),score=105.88 TRINITY_DN10947_c0_g1_i1:50-1588(-)
MKAQLFIVLIALSGVLGYSIQWEYTNGTATYNDPGSYSNIGNYDPNNLPPARVSSSGGLDGTSTLWLFGGSTSLLGSSALYSDLWKWNGTWFWMAGSPDPNVAGTYGNKGTPAASNNPGARRDSFGIPTATGDAFYLFGGNALDVTGTYGNANDLWVFRSGQWTWLTGNKNGTNAGIYGNMGTAAAANSPGSRAGHTGVRDSTGNVWIFGGYGSASGTSSGYLNDLWMFNVGTTQWTWMAGSNTAGQVSDGTFPAARQGSTMAIDSKNNLFLYGGFGVLGTSTGYLSDLWRISATNGAALLKGTTTQSASPRWGTKGLPEFANTPGGRLQHVAGVDADDVFWVYGGQRNVQGSAVLNDFWRFSGNWTWMAGANETNNGGSYPTTFGIIGPSYAPPARYQLLGGFYNGGVNGSRFIITTGGAQPGTLNDLWRSLVIPDPPSSTVASSVSSSSTTGSSSTDSTTSSQPSGTTPSSTSRSGSRTVPSGSVTTQDTSSDASFLVASLVLSAFGLML